MATTAALVFSSPNVLRYLLTADAMGGAVTIPNDAGASPDLQTDASPGPLKRMFQARLTGYGTIPAGALTQAQARSIVAGDNTGASCGNSNIQRGKIQVVDRTGTTEWIIDVNVDGAGDPVIAVTATAAAGTAYVEITAPGTIGQ